VNWSGAWAVSFTFNFLMDWSSSGKPELLKSGTKYKLLIMELTPWFSLFRYILGVLGILSANSSLRGQVCARNQRKNTGRNPEKYQFIESRRF